MYATFKPAVQSFVMPENVARAQFPGAHLVVTYKGGRVIYAEGDSVDKCYQVCVGAVRVYGLISDGRRQVVSFHLAGETFGFEATSKHRFFAEAIAETRIIAFARRPMQEHSPELLALALDGMKRAQEHLLVIGRQCAVERVAAFLMDLSDRLGGVRQIRLPMSRQDIADYLALTIETVSRAMTELKERKVIALRHVRTVDIIKPDALRSLCHQAALRS
ncbi:nitrogen fixation transcriptional regulator FixK (plasmid) [Rhizobium gallicum]|uniref:Nitrogen fixation transcriptional regulator FixK n=1 Tax=Rhizobium gallicum TaxID=56730 RepID=A0A1L5NQP0_9HYPH|nr:helix-turn-helix domain-containing protein [Rhizobium gallicum]APO70226.1 nitrogen fixation transcriptional regulator FixK [Rhizobium gallicum]